jgi:hypothetical protein
MATWTQVDLDRLKAAILALALGEGVQTVSYDGPPKRMISYSPRDLGAMRALLASMQQDVGGAAGEASYRLIATRKGL